jgi:hypothetical protein
MPRPSARETKPIRIGSLPKIWWSLSFNRTAPDLLKAPDLIRNTGTMLCRESMVDKLLAFGMNLALQSQKTGSTIGRS